MTAAVADGARSPSPRPHPTQSRDLVEAGERGTTTLADRVVEKVAAQAAAEVAGTAELDRRLSERLPGRTAVTARASATISGRLVQLRLVIAVAYPVSIVEVTREVRRHVSDTVHRLCDVDVRDVDVVVGRLRRTATGKRVL